MALHAVGQCMAHAWRMCWAVHTRKQARKRTHARSTCHADFCACALAFTPEAPNLPVRTTCVHVPPMCSATVRS